MTIKNALSKLTINELNKGDKVVYLMRGTPDGNGGFRDVEVHGMVSAISEVSDDMAKRFDDTPGRKWKADIDIPDEITGRGTRTVVIKADEVPSRILRKL